VGSVERQVRTSLVAPFSGIWSNLFAASLQDSLYWSSEPSQFWDRWAQDQANLGRCLGFSVGKRWACQVGVSEACGPQLLSFPHSHHGDWDEGSEASFS
jgi:hypothetical protein